LQVGEAHSGGLAADYGPEQAVEERHRRQGAAEAQPEDFSFPETASHELKSQNENAEAYENQTGIDAGGDEAVGRGGYGLFAEDLGVDVGFEAAIFSRGGGDKIERSLFDGRGEFAGVGFASRGWRSRVLKRSSEGCRRLGTGRRLLLLERDYVGGGSGGGEERGLGICTRRKFFKLNGLSVVGDHCGYGEGVGSDISRRRGDDDSAHAAPTTQTAMIVFTICETAVLAVHLFLLLFPLLLFYGKSLPQLATQFMPCYGCLLRLFRRICPNSLSNINMVACHGIFLRQRVNRCLLALALVSGGAITLFAQNAEQAPTVAVIAPGLPPPPPPQDSATVERPDFNVKIPRPNAPARGEHDFTSDSQDLDNGVNRLHGNVTVELFDATFKADEAEYDENTHIFSARGNVSYRNYDRNELIYCDRAEYNTDTQRGTFYGVRGYTKTKVVARRGILTTQEPFYFEGAYAEKFENKYIIHDGFITDCHVPNPWWTLHSAIFDIIPEDRAVTHWSLFRLRGIPLFYFPYFYKSLKKEPRKSGFKTPEFGHSSQFGYFVGTGYYWAINRSYDMTYLLTDYTARGLAHHVDFRGKPTDKSDFNVIVYGVQDRGVDVNGTVEKAPGVSIVGTGKIDFGDGWTARGNLDYLSSFLFRQTFSYGFNEAVYSSTNSVGYVAKNFGAYTFNTSVSENQNFETSTPGDIVEIRKLPEFEFQGRDQQIGTLPAWFSFDTTAGLYHRVQPDPTTGPPDGPFYETTQFSPRTAIAPSLVTSFHWGDFNIIPSFTMHDTYYGQQLNAATSTMTSNGLMVNAPELKIDFVLPPIERVYDKKTFLGDKLKHVIEPRLVYDYVTGVNNFLNTVRYDGTDLISDTNELEIGLTNRLYAKRGDTVLEVFTWELYQKRYFDPTFGGAVVAGQRNVVWSAIDLTGYDFMSGPRNYSPIVSVLRSNPVNGISFQWEADYDPAYHRVTNSLFSVDVRLKKYHFGAGHSIVHTNPLVTPPADQIQGSVGYGDANRKGWNTALTSVYDFRQAKLLYAIVQVTYNTDCCGFSVEMRRVNVGARDDTTYLVAFSIANIGTFGNLNKQERLF